MKVQEGDWVTYIEEGFGTILIKNRDYKVLGIIEATGLVEHNQFLIKGNDGKNHIFNSCRFRLNESEVAKKILKSYDLNSD
jgi:hypothetical protein